MGCGRNRYWSLDLLPRLRTTAAQAVYPERPLVNRSQRRTRTGGSIRYSDRTLQRNFPTLPDRVLLLPCHPAAPSDCQETLCVPFFLDDGTGKLLVDPRGAETDLQTSFSEDVEWDSAPDYIRHYLSRHGVTSDQVEEYCIRANDRLFVTGTLRDNPAIDQMNENSARCSQAEGLRYLSPEVADLQREFAFPGLEKLPAYNSWSTRHPIEEHYEHPSTICFLFCGEA
jgi:hypothetical protein